MPTRLDIERWGPMIFGVTSTAAWWLLDARIADFIAKELLSALLSAAAIAAGFLATAISILLPMTRTSTGLWLQKKGYLPHLIKYLGRAIYSCLALACVCVVAFFMLVEKEDVPHSIALVIIFSATYTVAALARIAEVLMNLFERASEPEDKNG